MTTAQLTLAAFVLRMVEADEAAARARVGIFPSPVVMDDGAVALHLQSGGQAVVTWYRDPAAGHDDMRVLREWADADGHDPARVLAECAAKRAIVELVSGWRHHVLEEDCWYTCAAATEEADGGECCDDSRRGTGCDCGLDYRRAEWA